MSSHESFEELSALATTGDLDEEQFRRLQEHLLECSECRTAYDDFHFIVEQGLPVLEPGGVRARLPRFGLKRRFAERIRKEGIGFARSGSRWWARWRVLEVTGIFLLVLLGMNYAWHSSGSDQAGSAEAARQVALLNSRLADLQDQLSELRERQAAPASSPSVPEPRPSERERDLEKLLVRAEEDLRVAIDDKERSITGLAAQLEQTRREADAANVESASTRRTLQDAERTLSGAKREIESYRNTASASKAIITEQETRLNQLNERVRSQTETIQREQDLLAAGRDIRDLMGARDLKIIDVIDVDPSSKGRPIPGRIFYTRGKSLIFYAYDLQTKGKPTDVFQVWGKKDGRTQPARSLGIFYVDDLAQNRWMMKFEDPKVLTEIDQVFVTVEPRVSRQPNGKQLLSAAFLNEAANHP